MITASWCSTIQRFNDSTNPWPAKALATAARGDSPRLDARHQKILFPNNPANMPIIR